MKLEPHVIISIFIYEQGWDREELFLQVTNKWDVSHRGRLSKPRQANFDREGSAGKMYLAQEID